MLRDNRLLLFGVHFFFCCAITFFILTILRIVCIIIPSFETKLLNVLHFLLDLTFLFFGVFVLLALINFALRKKTETKRWLEIHPLTEPKMCIGMTAYNDEESIYPAVRDFVEQKYVQKVIVVDNDSKDRTEEEAERAGAVVINETTRGYGAVCIRALKECLNTDVNLICLVEGDCTFSGGDLKKLLSYIENADMVLGTRTTRELNTPDSQMNFPLVWGNIFAAKLLQIRFWRVRLTDLGCTFRLIRKEAILKIIDKLSVTGNHFSCEMILEALKNNLMVIEVPVSLKKRVGKSKGVGGNFIKAAKTAIKMWWLILFR